MRRTLIVMLTCLLAGCGAEVVGTAAVTGAARAQEAQQARQTMERVQQRLDAANQTAQEQRDAAEKASGQ
jgi:uncharacterized protein YceK